MAANYGDYYYLIVRDPGRQLVAVEGTGADRGIFWSLSDAENTAALLSVHNPQYIYDVHRIASKNDRIKGVVTRYREGNKLSLRAPRYRRYVVFTAVVLVGVGVFVGIRLTASAGQPRLSLGGVWVAIPAGWTSRGLPASQQVAAAEPDLSPPCPSSLFGGPPACQDGLSLTRAHGTDVITVLQQMSRTRFTAMHRFLADVTVLGRRVARIGGCPAYMTEWKVRWTSPPETLEEGVSLKAGNAGVVYIFIRFADTSSSSAQARINDLLSAIRCNK